MRNSSAKWPDCSGGRPSAEGTCHDAAHYLLYFGRRLGWQVNRWGIGAPEGSGADARGVTRAAGFEVAAVNILRPDGSFETVAVEGGEEIQTALLGSVGTAEQWRRLMEESSRWGELLFISHEEPIVHDEALPSWRPVLEESDDPDRWHPDDMLMVFSHHASVAIEHALLYEQVSSTTEALRWAATHDALTGLHNRSVFDDQVPCLAALPDHQLAVLVIDLDGFKRVNDEAGHLVGDELLTVVAERIRSCVRAEDLVTRTGGDEFAVIISDPQAGLVAADLLRRLNRVIAEPIALAGGVWQVGASIGAASEETPVDPHQLLAQADAGMYQVKHSKR